VSSPVRRQLLLPFRDRLAIYLLFAPGALPAASRQAFLPFFSHRHAHPRFDRRIAARLFRSHAASMSFSCRCSRPATAVQIHLTARVSEYLSLIMTWTWGSAFCFRCRAASQLLARAGFNHLGADVPDGEALLLQSSSCSRVAAVRPTPTLSPRSPICARAVGRRCCSTTLHLRGEAFADKKRLRPPETPTPSPIPPRRPRPLRPSKKRLEQRRAHILRDGRVSAASSV